MEKFTLTCSDPHPWDVNPELQKLTVPEYLLERSRYYALYGSDPVMIIDGATGVETRFSEFDPLTGNVASWFYAHGMAKGDIVLYMVGNFSKLVLFQNGVWRANGLTRASYPQDTEETIRERIMESKAKWIYCDAKEAAKCQSVASKINWIVTVIVNGTMDNCVSVDELLEFKGSVPPLEITPEDPALILLTSGSTGKPKGALRTHKAFLKCIISGGLHGLQQPFMLQASGVHISGTVFSMIAAAIGITTIIGWKADTVSMMEAIHKYKPRMMWAFPSYFLQILGEEAKDNYDLSSLEYPLVGGVSVSTSFDEKMKGFKNYKKTCVVYGTTESAFFAGFCKFLDPYKIEIQDRKDSEIGTAMPGAQIRIYDPETGKVLGPNEKGEICIKSADLISEYVNAPEKTQEAFNSDGFYKTGDVGSYDERGYLSIFGRAKEVFKYHGYHISPSDIDAVVSQHPAVLQACAVGVVHSDGFDTVPRVFLTLKPGFKVSPEEIRSFADEKLPDYMNLRGGVFIVDTLPRADSGKVTRHLVSKLNTAIKG